MTHEQYILQIISQLLGINDPLISLNFLRFKIYILALQWLSDFFGIPKRSQFILSFLVVFNFSFKIWNFTTRPISIPEVPNSLSYLLQSILITTNIEHTYIYMELCPNALLLWRLLRRSKRWSSQKRIPTLFNSLLQPEPQPRWHRCWISTAA